MTRGFFIKKVESARMGDADLLLLLSTALSDADQHMLYNERTGYANEIIHQFVSSHFQVDTNHYDDERINRFFKAPDEAGLIWLFDYMRIKGKEDFQRVMYESQGEQSLALVTKHAVFHEYHAFGIPHISYAYNASIVTRKYALAFLHLVEQCSIDQPQDYYVKALDKIISKYVNIRNNVRGYTVQWSYEEASRRIGDVDSETPSIIFKSWIDAMSTFRDSFTASSDESDKLLVKRLTVLIAKANKDDDDSLNDLWRPDNVKFMHPRLVDIAFRKRLVGLYTNIQRRRVNQNREEILLGPFNEAIERFLQKSAQDAMWEDENGVEIDWTLRTYIDVLVRSGLFETISHTDVNIVNEIRNYTVVLNDLNAWRIRFLRMFIDVYIRSRCIVDHVKKVINFGKCGPYAHPSLVHEVPEEKSLVGVWTGTGDIENLFYYSLLMLMFEVDKISIVPKARVIPQERFFELMTKINDVETEADLIRPIEPYNYHIEPIRERPRPVVVAPEPDMVIDVPEVVRPREPTVRPQVPVIQDIPRPREPEATPNIFLPFLPTPKRPQVPVIEDIPLPDNPEVLPERARITISVDERNRINDLRIFLSRDVENRVQLITADRIEHNYPHTDFNALCNGAFGQGSVLGKWLTDANIMLAASLFVSLPHGSPVPDVPIFVQSGNAMLSHMNLYFPNNMTYQDRVENNLPFDVFLRNIVVAIPVTNAFRTETEASHWSLLLIYNANAYYLDSTNNISNSNSNYVMAKRMYAKIRANDLTQAEFKDKLVITHIPVPDQRNGWACGYYVIMILRLLSVFLREQGGDMDNIETFFKDKKVQEAFTLADYIETATIMLKELMGGRRYRRDTPKPTVPAPNQGRPILKVTRTSDIPVPQRPLLILPEPSTIIPVLPPPFFFVPPEEPVVKPPVVAPRKDDSDTESSSTSESDTSSDDDYDNPDNRSLFHDEFEEKHAATLKKISDAGIKIPALFYRYSNEDKEKFLVFLSKIKDHKEMSTLKRWISNHGENVIMDIYDKWFRYRKKPYDTVNLSQYDDLISITMLQNRVKSRHMVLSDQFYLYLEKKIDKGRSILTAILDVEALPLREFIRVHGEWSICVVLEKRLLPIHLWSTLTDVKTSLKHYEAKTLECMALLPGAMQHLVGIKKESAYLYDHDHAPLDPTTQPSELFRVAVDKEERRKNISYNASDECDFFNTYQNGYYVGSGTFGFVVLYRFEKENGNMPSVVAVKFQPNIELTKRGKSDSRRIGAVDERNIMLAIQRAWVLNRKDKRFYHHIEVFDYAKCKFNPNERVYNTFFNKKDDVVESFYKKLNHIDETGYIHPMRPDNPEQLEMDMTVMSYALNGSLSDLIAFNHRNYTEPFNMPLFINVIIQVSGYLYSLYDNLGIVHHDITPSNILIQQVDNNTIKFLSYRVSNNPKTPFLVIPYPGFVCKVADYGKAYMGRDWVNPCFDVENLVLAYLQWVLSAQLTLNGEKDTKLDPVAYLYKNPDIVYFLLKVIRTKEQAAIDYDVEGERRNKKEKEPQPVLEEGEIREEDEMAHLPMDKETIARRNTLFCYRLVYDAFMHVIAVKEKKPNTKKTFLTAEIVQTLKKAGLIDKHDDEITVFMTCLNEIYMHNDLWRAIYPLEVYHTNAYTRLFDAIREFYPNVVMDNAFIEENNEFTVMMMNDYSKK